MQSLIRNWHDAFGIKRGYKPSMNVSEETHTIRRRIIEEEYLELMEALDERDIEHVAKELGDLAWVVYGAADVYGIDLDEVMARIYESNMSKFGPNREILRREDGKILKGPNYFEPDLSYLRGDQD
jgi:NTP pyrophosphatase (non-canonical NTP hydrolase)